MAHVSPPPADFAAALRSFGLPDFYAKDLTAMFVAIRDAGTTHAVTDTVERAAGRPASDVRTFAREVIAPALAAAQPA